MTPGEAQAWLDSSYGRRPPLPPVCQRVLDHARGERWGAVRLLTERVIKRRDPADPIVRWCWQRHVGAAASIIELRGRDPMLQAELFDLWDGFRPRGGDVSTAGLEADMLELFGRYEDAIRVRSAVDPLGRSQRTRRANAIASAAAASKGTFPHVLVVGAQKAGTTTLHAVLSSLPRVMGPVRREMHYLDRTLSFAKGHGWYRAAFAQAVGGEVVFEKTPSYLSSPVAPLRAMSLPEDARFVVILRHPVDRAYSAFRMIRGKGKWKAGVGFGEALERDREAIGVLEADGDGPRGNSTMYGRGLYGRQLRRWFEAVGRERVYVASFESLFVRGEAEAIGALAEFIGVELPEAGWPHERRGGGEGLDESARAELMRLFATSDAEVEALLGYRPY